MNRLVRPILLGSTATAVAFLLCACDSSRRLPNGYELVHTSNRYVVITRGSSGQGVIDANVERYAVLPNAIVGYAGKAPIEAGHVKTGYFIIELPGTNVREGLSKNQWLTRLRQLGVKTEPRLEQPN